MAAEGGGAPRKVEEVASFPTGQSAQWGRELGVWAGFPRGWCVLVLPLPAHQPPHPPSGLGFRTQADWEAGGLCGWGGGLSPERGWL